MELKQFLAYLTNGHEDPRGRWGNPALHKQVCPKTVSTYYTNLRTLFRCLVDERALGSSPIEGIRPPIFRRDQVQPFTQAQTTALLLAAHRSKHKRRDEAIILFLLDTGVRAAELCALRMCDLDMDGRRCRVLGKGNKHRNVYFGRTTTKALWQYLMEEPREQVSHLFLSD